MNLAVDYLKNRRHHAQRVLYKVFIYILLVNSAFVLLYPILYMTTTALMTLDDFYDPSVRWIPIHIRWNNFVLAYEQMEYLEAFGNSALITVLSVIGQVLSTASSSTSSPSATSSKASNAPELRGNK